MKNHPKVRILDHDFYVDIANRQFEDVGSPSNVIPFDQLILADTRSYYVLNYDPKINNAFKGEYIEFLQRKDLVIVTVPLLETLNPAGMKELITGKPMDKKAVVIDAEPVVLKTKSTRKVR